MAISIVTESPDRRADRYRLRHGLNALSRMTKFQTCGAAARGEAVEIKGGRREDGTVRASAHGLVSCGSIHSCPVCAPHIRAERASELETALETHKARGGGALFVTLTLRHEAADGLQALLDALYSGWRKMQQGRAWREAVEAVGVIGWVRAMEVTWGYDAGWHPHLHIILLTEGKVVPWRRDDLEAVATEQWIKITDGYGFGGLPGIAATVKRVKDLPTMAESLAGYTVKGDKIHLEVGRGDLKKPWNRDRWSPFEILDAATQGESWALHRWWEYEEVTNRRRAIEWSRGLRALLGVGAERSESEIVEDQATDQLDDVEVIIEVAADAWRMVSRQRRTFDLLRAAETAGALGVCVVVQESIDACLAGAGQRMRLGASAP